MENMLNTGKTRKIDNLGRVVLPIKIRKQFKIKAYDEISIHIDTKNDSIILQTTESYCTFCNAADNLISFNQHYVCENCIKNLINQMEVVRKIS